MYKVKPILMLTHTYLLVGVLFCSLYANGFGGSMSRTKQHQDDSKSQQSKKTQPSSAQSDSIDIQTQRLEKELGLDDLQKIKVEKFANELRDNLNTLNNISRLEYEQFIVNGSFDKSAFLLSAQKKTKLLTELQGEFIEKLFSVLDDSQKSKIKKVPLLLVWQKGEFENTARNKPE